jgi:hypothetical protein
LTRRYETPDVTFEAQEVDWSPLAGMRCLNQFMLKGHANQVRELVSEAQGRLPGCQVELARR